jgi:hypothetical protein
MMCIGTYLDEDVWQEVQEYRKALVKLFRCRYFTFKPAVRIRDVLYWIRIFFFISVPGSGYERFFIQDP